MSTRRRFIKQGIVGAAALSLPIIPSCTPKATEAPPISLAQWSLHRAIRKGEVDPIDFASITKNTFGLEAIEYVNSFYADKKSNTTYWTDIKSRANQEGVKNLLIMVDAEGELGDANDVKRLEAVDKHKIWVDIAARLGCHSIRVNAFGAEEADLIQAALVDGLGSLAEYSQTAEVNILIENHGLFSSDAAFMVEVIKEINHPYVGTLPDFGNWCSSEKWGGTSEDGCETVYDQALGVEEFMPYAKGVSAKTYDFNADGGQDRINYKNLLQIVKNNGYQGHIGVEYEGSNLSEEAGILATVQLINDTWAMLD